MRADGIRLMSRTSILLIVALGIVAVVARFLWLHAARPERVSDRQRPAESARVVPDADGVASTPGRSARRSPAPLSAPEAPRDETGATTTTPELERKLAADLRQKARFPKTSRRIEDNVNPIVATRAVKERLSPPRQGRTPTLVVFSSSLSYEAPSPIILFAKFIRDYPKDWSTRTDGEIAGELLNDENQVVAQVDFLDDGEGRDIEAHDGVFTTRLTPAPEDLDAWNGLIRVKVYGETADGDRRTATTRFYYGEPSAKLTGNYQDRLVDGHLQILAEVDVKEAGQFRLDATVSGAQGLLAWGQNTVALAPGIGWLPVTFWGLALREANEPGPYQLSSVALADVSKKPPQLNDAFGTTYHTAPYKPTDFSDQSYDDPKLLERAARAEARARGETSHAQ